MNKSRQAAPKTQRIARVRYGTPDIEILQEGDVVLCAITGEAIPLLSLKYWSKEKQQAYVSVEVAFACFKENQCSTRR